MVGFQGGESAETASRKKGYRREAQQRWTFLTHYDLSTIKNEVQLRAMVKTPLGHHLGPGGEQCSSLDAG